MKPRRTEAIEEFLQNQDEDFTDYGQVRPRDDSLDRMDEEDVDMLHVEEV